MWHALRGNLAFFLVGSILGACVATVATPKSDIQLELESIQIDTIRNTEKITELNRQVQTIFDWISADDRQKIRDAEILGGIRITVANHDKLVWLAFVNLVGITALLARQVFIDRKKKG